MSARDWCGNCDEAALRGPIAPSDLCWAVEQLQRRGVQPITHENGFIQLKLNDRQRLHVWPDGSRGQVAKQKTDSPIHDHAFDFTSLVLVGAIQHCVYLLGHQQHPTHEIARVVDGKLQLTGIPTTPRLMTVCNLSTGTDYTFERGYFHETKWSPLSATLMTKIAGEYRDPDAGLPRVLCVKGEVPDNDFDRATANPPAMLWAYIYAALAHLS